MVGLPDIDNIAQAPCVSAAILSGAGNLNRRPAAERYDPCMEGRERISVDPAVRSGKPCIKATRITVYDILEYLAGGMSEKQILSNFPDLTPEDIRACLAFAAARERRLKNSVA